MYLNGTKNKISALVSSLVTTILMSERVQLNHFASFLSKQCLPPLISRNDSCTDWFSRNPVAQHGIQLFALFKTNMNLWPCHKYNKNNITRMLIDDGQAIY